jgi:hypothetical protein
MGRQADDDQHGFVSAGPRCPARSDTIVEMFSSRLPTEALYADGSIPHAEDDGRRRTPSWR